ncbi:MAG: lipoxygenase family protein [Oligoflexus sp.]
MAVFDRVKLPQNDPEGSKRRQQLAAFQEKFQFDQTVIRNVPISASVPEEAKAGPGWSLRIIATSYKLRRNWEKLLGKFRYVFEEPLPQKATHEIASMLLNKDLLGLLAYTDPDLGLALDQQRPQTFDQYFKLFQHMSIPDSTQELYDDKAFADYFVAGLNPLMIHLIKDIPEKLVLNNHIFHSHPLFHDDDLETALQENRLFLVDYEILSALEPGEHPAQPKFIYTPIVVLAVPRGSNNLEVIGIQYGQDGNTYPFVTPQDSRWDWLIAKTMVKTADINYHEVVSHLGLTHLVIDPIVVATYRQLAQNHPLHQLLLPHFEGTLPINALAVRRLINQGGKVEQLLAPEINSAYGVIEAIRNKFHFRDSFLHADLKNRGVDTASTIKSYPYRDDAYLIWDAIQNWVSDYVNIYYQTDADVLHDTELALWTAEIVDPDAGRIQGFAPNNRITTKSILVETLTMIIFTASAQHAAVNFPQGKAAAVPYQPLAGYAPAPKYKGQTEKDAVAFLPPLDRAIKQVHTLTLLGDTYYTQLGGYALGTFDDKTVVPRLWKFQAQLRLIEKEIKRRNQERRTPYPYLQPSKIPQSINI